MLHGILEQRLLARVERRMWKQHKVAFSSGIRLVEHLIASTAIWVSFLLSYPPSHSPSIPLCM